MPNENSRNTIIFIVCAAVILIGYQIFVLDPAAKKRQAAMKQAEASQTVQGKTPALQPAAKPKPTRAAAAGTSPRVRIDTPSLSGSIALRGARIDDLFLKRYRVTPDPKSAPVELFRPEGAEHAWFAELGWTGANLPGAPNPDTLWTLTGGDVLSPGKPVTLTYSNGQGLTFTRRLSVDDKFMFTVTDTVANASPTMVTIAPYASVQRQGIPADLGKTQIVHEGAIGALQDRLQMVKYQKWKKEGGPALTSKGGWVGITDKYWLAALVPPQGEQIKGAFRVTDAGGVDVYEANYVGAARQVLPGKQVTEESHIFAGAKVAPQLKAYQDTLGVPRFDEAVDWGFLFFLTRPMFTFLDFIFQHVGSFGIAILVLTVAVRLLFFPLANKSYESITKMKKVQPQVEELRKRYKDDPQKQQQEMMQLYQREKINPLMGCIPIAVQIPVFYSLYKVLTVTIEMRHTPFFGWIKDLSARDPSTIWTLFGLIPWHPVSAPLIGTFLDGPLHLGVWPLVYGFSMWLSQSMNPPAPDPTQQRILSLMPIFFTFIMAPFAVGLIIYWSWSNLLSILQQYVMMRRFQVDNPIDSFIRKISGKPKAEV